MDMVLLNLKIVSTEG